MYIPELDALVFLSEFLDGRPEQPILQEGITALYATAGAFPTWLSGGCVTAAQVTSTAHLIVCCAGAKRAGRRRSMLPEILPRGRCEAQLRELHIISEVECFSYFHLWRNPADLCFGSLPHATNRRRTRLWRNPAGLC